MKKLLKLLSIHEETLNFDLVWVPSHAIDLQKIIFLTKTCVILGNRMVLLPSVRLIELATSDTVWCIAETVVGWKCVVERRFVDIHTSQLFNDEC